MINKDSIQNCENNWLAAQNILYIDKVTSTQNVASKHLTGGIEISVPWIRRTPIYIIDCKTGLLPKIIASDYSLSS